MLKIFYEFVYRMFQKEIGFEAQTSTIFQTGTIFDEDFFRVLR